LGKITEEQAAQELLTGATQNRINAQNNLNALLKQQQDLINRISDSEGQTQLIVELNAINEKIPKAKQLFNETAEAEKKAQEELNKFNKASKETLVTVEKIDKVVRSGGEGTIIDRIFGTTKQAGIGRTQQELDRILKTIEKIDNTVRAAGTSESSSGGIKKTLVDTLSNAFGKAQEYYGLIQSTIGQTLSTISNATQIRAEKEIQSLEQKRKRGLISEKQYENEVAKIKNEAAQKRRQVEIANAFALIPQAVLQAYIAGLSIGGLAAPIVAGVLAGVAGAFATAQAAMVAAAPLPQFREGGSVAKRLGLIRGKPHEQGGVPIEVEGDEFVMSKQAVKHYGVDFMEKVNKLKLSPVVTMQQRIENMKQSDYKLYEHLSTLGSYMKQDYRANESGNKILRDIHGALNRTTRYV
jgi:hypothetical protein